MTDENMQFPIVITQPMIDEYARLSGDHNPLHVDPAAAGASPFGATIAHGCIPMEPIFKAMQEIAGTPLLPEGSRMSLRYLRPSQPGDVIHFRQQQSGPEEAGVIGFACVNQRDEVVIEGVCQLPG